MLLEGKVVVVTGGASGIGRALCERFAAERVRGLAVADLDGVGCGAVATSLADRTRVLAVPTDVADEGQVVALVDQVEEQLGPIDLFCSNAGVAVGGGVEVADEDWQRLWAVNVMAHVHAARTLVPKMAARGGGYLLNTASAAGLLTNLGTAPYTVTKHAAVGLAEWLSITYAGTGIKVSCLCPQGVRTPMLLGGLRSEDASASAVAAAGDLKEPGEVADAVVAALAEERFFVLPHPEVADYARHKAEDPERWLTAMRRLWARLSPGTARPGD